MLRIALTALLTIGGAVSSAAADWPQFRGDAARSGYTAEPLPPRPVLAWVHRSRQEPAPAWPSRNRLRFDRAFQPIVAEGLVVLGSSADDQVYALDAATGRVRWTFTTDGPVRFAPAAWQDRLLVASDDGHLYCLELGTGQLAWKRRGGPSDDMLLGNDRMISRWPARGGPVVAGDTVYFGAGIWPSEGIFVYALDPRTGQVLWKNDSSGGIEMDQPHGTARAKSGISAQGYLAVAADRLVVPTGRAVPAVLDRAEGALVSFPLQAYQHAGGADVVLLDGFLINSGSVYSIDGKQKIGTVGPETAVTPDFLLSAADNKLSAIDRKRLVVQRELTDRKGNKQQVLRLTAPVWEVPLSYDAQLPPPTPKEEQSPAVRVDVTAWTSPALDGQPSALIVADRTAVVGGRGRVSTVDLAAQAPSWTADVEGTALGLAAAGGRLYVSTDRGCLYCFAERGASAVPAAEAEPVVPLPPSGEIASRAVDEILRQSGVTEGYCVDLGCGTGELALELARRTKLRILAVDASADNINRLRRALDRAGLYGERVAVHCCDPARVPYPDYCADLVVSGRLLSEKPDETLAARGERLLRPWGGVIATGPAGRMNVSKRGPLPGAGAWTHQNSSAANTLCSDEGRLRGPLEMLWYRDTDFVPANRHGRAPAALVQNGRIFVEGLRGLRAQSLYNGRVLWEFAAPGILDAYHREHSIGAAWTGGNMCLAADRVYLHNGKVCFVLDASTGENLAEWTPPLRPDGKAGAWGYIACDGGVLLGSVAREDYLVKCWSDRWDTGDQFTESTLLFALDARTGRLLWTFQPRDSIRHNAIAIGSGRVYLVDRPVAAQDALGFPDPPASASKRRGVAAASAETPDKNHPLGRLVALDLETGQVRWQSDEQIFGTLLIHSAEHGLVWMGYQAAHQASRASELGNRMAVFDATEGKRLWDRPADYADRPLLNGRTVYAPPGAWDLVTGQELPFQLERSYGCGTVAGCRTMLLFRSATLGYVDLEASPQTQNYGGIRPGCWIAAIPAGGVLLMPDAASWCSCSYLNQGTIVLRSAGER
ncbi:MAG: outer membrane protein assembly factor BamB family protein [Thermoguttaceae bacterium]